MDSDTNQDLNGQQSGQALQTACGRCPTAVDQMLAETLSEEDVAYCLGVSKATVAQLRLERKIPFVRITNQRNLYLRSSIMAWLAEREVPLAGDA